MMLSANLLFLASIDSGGITTERPQGTRRQPRWLGHLRYIRRLPTYVKDHLGRGGIKILSRIGETQWFGDPIFYSQANMTEEIQDAGVKEGKENWMEIFLFLVMQMQGIIYHIRDVSLIPGLGRFARGGHGNPLLYSFLQNPVDRGAWWAVVHRIAKSQTRLKQPSTHLFQRNKIFFFLSLSPSKMPTFINEL